jgi:hypothetical protein
MIKMRCPECDHVLRIATDFSRQKGRCKYCEARFIVGGEHFDTPYGDDLETQQERHTQENTIRRTTRPSIPNHGSPPIAIPPTRRRFPTVLIVALGILGLVAGAGFYWYSNGSETVLNNSITATFLNKTTTEPIEYSSVEIETILVPVLGEERYTLYEGRVSWNKTEPAGQHSQVYFTEMDRKYDDVASELPVALNQLGWDFIYWMEGAPKTATELDGTYEDKPVTMRIVDGISLTRVYVRVPTR